jgi:serine protease Do
LPRVPPLLRRIVLALVLAAVPAAAQDNLDVAAAGRSVVRVVVVGMAEGEPTGIGTGSGVAVAPDKILTNAHVLADAADGDAIIGIVPSEGRQRFTGRLIAYAPERDLALVQLLDGTVEPATIASGPVPDGAPVAAVGYPYSVDRARELSAEGYVTPQAPVKSWGRVSSGAPSQRFDTVLHDAAIGRGNSGGPLVDACGRVVGINSFVTNSEGIDAVFGFAVSAREMLPFLRGEGVRPRVTGVACRTSAEQAAIDDRLAREDAARLADERARADSAADRREARRDRLRDQIAVERENRIGLAALLLVLAGLAANGALLLWLMRRDDRRPAYAAAGAGALLVAGAAIAWGTRPDFDQADARLAAERPRAPATAAATGIAGRALCRVDLARSRITVSEPADLPLVWRADGCVDASRQFARGETGWRRATIARDEAAAAIQQFDPASGELRVDRYLLAADAAAAARALAEKHGAPGCSAAAAASAGELVAALDALLPQTPNERLVYRCSPADAAGIPPEKP